MYEETVIDLIDNNIYKNHLLEETTKNDIDELAEEFAVKRGYPAPIAQLVTERYD